MKRKKWTILIYADGNNEMEQVIYESMESLKGMEANKDISVVMEIGLLGKSEISTALKSSGVKRYNLNSPNPILLEDLGKVNMADPNNLYSFISWGIKEFPANHYMLILSGHGAGFVGGLTDISLEDNYIMGIPEMAKAIGAGSKDSKSIIDILLLDMCFMNSIEILHELTQYNDSIKRMITYTNAAPYSGLNYNALIKLTEKNSRIKDIDLFIRYIIDNLNFGLTAYRLDKSQLDFIKKKFSDLAFYYLMNKGVNESPISLVKNLSLKDTSGKYIDDTSYKYINEINSLIQSTIICSKSKFHGINSSIKITSEDMSKLIHFYSKLAFSKDNCWTNLLCSNQTNINTTATNKIKVRTINSSTSTIHYILEFNSLK
ncbi:MAG: clostripain-related cysteine peptidase [Clostridiaceae bacterium]